MEISESLDKVIDSIKETDTYKKYKHILKQVDDSKDINKIVIEIKKIQKDILKKEYKKDSRANDLIEKLGDKKKTLYSIPLYQDYIDTAEELNTLIKSVNNKFQSYLDTLDI